MFCCCSEMGRLRSCQGSLLRRTCGTSASDVLNQLFDIALRDPHYLRFGYRPDCRLHGAVSPPSSASRPPDVAGEMEDRPVVSSHTSVDVGRGGGRDALPAPTLPPSAGDLVQRQDGRAAAARHQGPTSFQLVAVASLLTAAAYVRIR